MSDARDDAGGKGLNAPELKAEARKLSHKALKTLEGIMDGQGADTVKLAAAREVLDRAHGRLKPGGAAKASSSRKKAPDSTQKGFTVVVQRFTDPPDPEVEDFP